MKFTFKEIVFTIIFGALICGFAFWQGQKELKMQELELQESKQQLEKTADKLVDTLEEVVKKSTPNPSSLNLSSFPEKEIKIINEAALRNNLKGFLYPILYAIRKAENGKNHIAFGIMNPEANTFDKQAGWCAATIQKNYDRWITAGSKGRYIEYLARRFCPVGAANDPDGLNKNWIGNVNSWVKKIRS